MDIHPLSAFITDSSPYTQFPEQLSNEEFWNLATQRAHSAPTIQAGANELLLCTLGHGYCILPLKMLSEILTPPHYFSLFPLPPVWMPGVSAWRGEVIAVIDMDAYLFFNPPASPGEHEEGMLLVTQHNDLKLGLFVSSVETIVGTYNEEFIPLQNGDGRYPRLRTHVMKGITQVHNKEALVLDTDHMFVDIEQNMRTTTPYE
jgi:chemotaxis signal transduction protein